MGFVLSLITGLVVGIISGLSTTPVISILLSSLTSFLTFIFGFVNKKNLAEYKIVVFCIFLILGLLAGISFRNYSILQPSLKEDVGLWSSVYDIEVAKKIVLYKRTGLNLFDKSTMNIELSKQISSGLFSSYDLGLRLNPDRFNNDVDNIMDYYKESGDSNLVSIYEGLKYNDKLKVFKGIYGLGE